MFLQLQLKVYTIGQKLAISLHFNVNQLTRIIEGNFFID